MFGQAQRAVNATDQNKLTRLAKSRDEYVRIMVANNHSTPPTVLEQLARDQNRLVKQAVARNPSSPMSLLRDMVIADYKRSRYGVWSDIAGRNDLTREVLKAFSQSSAYAAIDFIEGRLDRSTSLRQRANNGLLLNPSTNPLVIEAFLEIKDSQSYRFMNSTSLSLYEVIASLDARHLTARAMLVIAENGDAKAQRLLALNSWLMLTRDAATVLSASKDWEVLDRLRLCPDLNDNARKLVTEKVATYPEWIERQATLHENASKTPIQQKSEGRNTQGTARPESAFDSYPEEIFWDAYQKLKPKSLTGLVTQHWVGRYRLDFAIPNKRIGIEIDGHEFHSSKKQFVDDRQRQRNLEQKGWRITRFAAVEVSDDPEGCVRQAGKWVESQV